MILANRIQTPDGTILQSYHVHDYKTHIDRITGEEYMVDGGLNYFRRSQNVIPATDMTVYDTDPHYIIRDVFAWGTRGKDGKQPLVFKPISLLATDHIEAILETQHHIAPHLRKIFENELDYRSLKESPTVKLAYIALRIHGGVRLQETDQAPNVELTFDPLNNDLIGIKLI